MENKHLRRLFAYDQWANARVLDALKALAPLDAAAPMARLFSHILAAQDVWLAHIHSRPLSETVWPETAPDAWPGRMHALNQAWLHLLDTWDAGLDAPIAYRNTKGQSFETPLHEILLHVVIHGQHHRAQIAGGLRRQGHTPPPTDFIFYTRDPAAM